MIALFHKPSFRIALHIGAVESAESCLALAGIAGTPCFYFLAWLAVNFHALPSHAFIITAGISAVLSLGFALVAAVSGLVAVFTHH